MKKIKKLNYLIIILLFFSNKIMAKHPIKQEVLNNDILIGDIIKYKVTIENAENEIITIKTSDFSPFELIRKSRKLKKDNSIEYLFELSVYETGEQVIPEIKLTVKENEIIIPSKKIIVKSVLKNKDNKKLGIKDIKETVSVKENSYFLAYLFSGLFLLFILFVIFRKLKNKEKIAPIVIVEKLPAHEIAYKKLSELINLNLDKQGRLKEYFFILSEIIREFVGNRYDFDSIELTSGELISHIKSEPTFNRDYMIVINNFLEDSDLMKFSKIEATNQEIEEITKLAFKIVDDLKIKIMD